MCKYLTKIPGVISHSKETNATTLCTLSPMKTMGFTSEKTNIVMCSKYVTLSQNFSLLRKEDGI